MANPGDPVRWKKKGDKFFKSGDYIEAVQAYRKAIDLNPVYLAAWNNLGYSLLKLGETEEARRCFEKKEELRADENDGLSATGDTQDVPPMIQEAVIPGPMDQDSGDNKSPFNQIPPFDVPAGPSNEGDDAGVPAVAFSDSSASEIRAEVKAPEMIEGRQVSPIGKATRIKRYLPSVHRISANDTAFYFLAFFIAILFFAYIIPLLFSPIPSGTDVYLHMVSTERMYQSDSLVDFLDKSRYQEALLYDYPFGMWYIGSIIMKMTGITVGQLAILFPMILVLVSFVVYYAYAQKMLRKNEWAVLSLIFFISMPLIAINLLNFQTSRFISVFLIMILLIVVDEKRKWQNLLLVIAITFTMAITHTGTYMFLIFFTASYLVLYALIWKKFDWWMFGITATTIFMYVIAVQEFQFVQPQYIDKGRLVISVSDKIASISGLDIIRDMGTIFYDNIFVTNSMSYVIFWSAMIFSVGMIALWIHRKLENHIPSFRLTLPLIGSVNNVSHSILATPFWIGPVQTVLSIFGIFSLDSRGKCIFCTIIISAVLPASMQADVGTGALRQIYYLFLIIPITAAAGMMVLTPKIKQWTNSPKKRIFILPLLFLIFLPLIGAPIVGSIYYIPTISGTENERENLMWLGTVGSSQDGVAEYAYRERIDVYGKKDTPDIPQGTETNQYLNALHNVYFSEGSEQSVAELFSYNIHYLISSERILNAFDSRDESLKIDSNTRLDKLFSSDHHFGFYHVNDQSSKQITPPVNETLSYGQIRFDEQPVTIQDVGSSYQVETAYYKIRIGKSHPAILYLGTNFENILGDGALTDQIIVNSRFGSDVDSASYTLSDLSCDSVVVSGNTVQYHAILKNESDQDRMATIQVVYTFLEKSMKMEVMIANDQIRDISAMNVFLGTTIFSPASSFEYVDLTGEVETEVSRRIYPSQDSISIRDVKTNQIYLDQQETGILIYYDDLAPYPDRILYKGSISNDYGSVYIQSEYSPPPGDTCLFVRYFAIGEKQVASLCIEDYTSVTVYDYPEGIIPLVVISPRSTAGWDGILNYSLPKSGFQTYSVTFPEGMKNYQIQYDELAAVSLENGTTGIAVPDLQYNLDTIRALNDNSLKGLAGFPVIAPTAWLFKEGRRNLKVAYYEGEQSGVILVPVSLPQSGLIGRGGNLEEIFSSWNDVIDSVIQYDEVAVFFWDPEDFSSWDLQERLVYLIDSAEEKGMTITPLDTLINHKFLLENIVVKVNKDIDMVDLEFHNNNQEHIQGFTVRVVLPEIDGGYSYTVSEGGRIVRVDRESDRCIMYVACDLEPYEIRKITIEPSEERKRFGIDFTKLYHGTNTMIIRDDEGNKVGEALIRVGGQSYQSDAEGVVTFYVRRGVTNISVEKPGFRSRNVQINVKSKLSRYLETIMDDMVK